MVEIDHALLKILVMFLSLMVFILAGLSSYFYHQKKRIQKKLEVISKKTQEALSFKNCFVDMSHEMRTPLHCIVGTSSLLQRLKIVNTDTKARKYLERLTLSSQLLLKLVNNNLDSSRLIECQPLDYKQLVTDVVELLKSQAHVKGIELIFLSPDRSITVNSDPHRLKQIAINLISNALKFTEKGIVGVKLEEVTREDKKFIRLEVEDQGIGIEQCHHTSIFERYAQVETHQKVEGTGLGLAICKQMAEQLQGSIGLSSQLGFGSKFWFEIPFGHKFPPK